ncbi:hypothetical protein [Photobacterium lucens]|uniref:hypothetical protein n=1 Tax=Photobacterium lucens TaxID=2562949 RepID=UPI0013706525|nr:hypothetical protein [Photobacterium lucens]MBP2699729.1 hypothetical protein [Vibrio parahaemolyticus]MZG55127.1 hypothetical protein [Photobacterium lucens]MZG79170.1 hypothetical protein [Photobacterium lucens]
MSYLGLSEILSGLIGVLVGALIGNRLALSRDKRKEYNLLVIPVREVLIKQLSILNDGNFQHGLNESDIEKLQARSSNSEFKRIKKIYNTYDHYRSNSGTHDLYGNFTKNDEYFKKFTDQTTLFLNSLNLK